MENYDKWRYEVYFSWLEGPLVKDCLWFLTLLFAYWSHHWPCFSITQTLQNNHRMIILVICLVNSMIIYFSLTLLFLLQFKYIFSQKFCLIYFIFNSRWSKIHLSLSLSLSSRSQNSTFSAISIRTLLVVSYRKPNLN